MDVAVVDYGVSNLCSVVRALDYLGYDAQLITRPEELARAPRLILPGQGAFATAMHNLQAAGLAEALQTQWKAGKPIMGICVGMQIMARIGLENGNWPGLGWLDAECHPLDTKNLPFTGAETFAETFIEVETGETDSAVSSHPALVQRPLKLPHVGWNELRYAAGEPLFAGLKSRDRCVYFTHSYALTIDTRHEAAAASVIATCDYGGAFVAAVKQDNIFATQFHPEKSQENGLRILDNFMNWRPC